MGYSIGMKIAILGYGEQGRSAYEYWNKPGNEITVCDQNESVILPDDVKKQMGPDHLNGLGQFDLIVRSPIVHPSNIVAANLPEILSKVTTVTNEFMKVCPTKNIIGVTGTKGKGTTSTLIAKILEADGKTVHLGGNIGIAPLDLLKNNIKPEDYVVLELANFQLIDLKNSPHIAVCLMVVDEHLDWHKDIEEYITAKQQLFLRQTPDDIAIYYGLNDYSQHIAGVSPGHKLPYMKHPGADVIEGVVTIDGQTICKTEELKLLGKHNWQNVCAAVTAVWQVTQNIEAIYSVLTTFVGLPFRIELRKKIEGMSFYNDSFASQPSATIAAIEAIHEPKVLIIGGQDRMLDLADLAKALQSSKSIRSVILIGESAARTSQTLEKQSFENFELSSVKDMESIVKLAQSKAKKGDAVVLSPGFPSFDMFKNFEDRGNQFNTVVDKL